MTLPEYWTDPAYICFEKMIDSSVLKASVCWEYEDMSWPVVKPQRLGGLDFMGNRPVVNLIIHSSENT